MQCSGMFNACLSASGLYTEKPIELVINMSNDGCFRKQRRIIYPITFGYLPRLIGLLQFGHNPECHTNLDIAQLRNDNLNIYAQYICIRFTSFFR